MITIDELTTHLQTEILKDSSLSIEPDQDLLLSGLMDSLAVVRLASYLESRCNITIPPEDVVLENFGTLNLIMTYISTLK